MARKILLLIMATFMLAPGGFWALQAQDPAPQMPRTNPQTVSAQTTTQTDLSGTYTGTFNCEALGLTGDTTLTITGNEFTTADGKSGRIVASTTGGYTAVAFQVGGTGTPATTVAAAPAAAPMIVSLRARKSGSRLTLTAAPGSAMKCSFVPSRGVARSRRNQRTPAATGTEVSAPATMPSAVPTESPKPSQTPSPVPPPSPEPSPTPSPEPMPSPTPSGSPTPAPPTPSPTPGEPTPSPTPSPTPTPSPSPRVGR